MTTELQIYLEARNTAKANYLEEKNAELSKEIAQREIVEPKLELEAYYLWFTHHNRIARQQI